MKIGKKDAVFHRVLELQGDLKSRSLLLFGARQTGRRTLLRRSFPDARHVDLLEADTYRTLAFRPETLRESLRGDERLIVVDEVQKLPSLLDEVQLLSDRNPRLRFVLTGSSARKLRRRGTNLLGGVHEHATCSRSFGPNTVVRTSRASCRSARSPRSCFRGSLTRTSRVMSAPT